MLISQISNLHTGICPFWSLRGFLFFHLLLFVFNLESKNILLSLSLFFLWIILPLKHEHRMPCSLTGSRTQEYNKIPETKNNLDVKISSLCLPFEFYPETQNVKQIKLEPMWLKGGPQGCLLWGLRKVGQGNWKFTKLENLYGLFQLEGYMIQNKEQTFSLFSQNLRIIPYNKCDRWTKQWLTWVCSQPLPDSDPPLGWFQAVSLPHSPSRVL